MKNYIKVLFPLDEHEDIQYESAWAKKKGDFYQLDNILFYAKEYSLGDLFSVKKNENEYYVDQLVEESGHSTIRILFNDLSKLVEIRSELKKIGCHSELSNLNNLISVDVPNSINYKKLVKPILDNGEILELWEYQESCISTIHSNT
jgi:hypothetical protein